MNIRLVLFLLLVMLYFLHDKVLSKVFMRNYRKKDYYLGKKASDETQKFFGKAVYMVMIYYAVLLIYLITGYTFNGLISNIDVIDKPFWQFAGFLIGIASLILMTVSRLTLGSSWRVGLDTASTETLVIHGFYKYIRNPYFSFLLTFQFSIILLVPNAISIFAFIQSLILLKMQVYQEEAFLLQKYGEPYTAYKNMAGRFFLKIWK